MIIQIYAIDAIKLAIFLSFASKKNYKNVYFACNNIKMIYVNLLSYVLIVNSLVIFKKIVSKVYLISVKYVEKMVIMKNSVMFCRLKMFRFKIIIKNS